MAAFVPDLAPDGRRQDLIIVMILGYGAGAWSTRSIDDAT